MSRLKSGAILFLLLVLGYLLLTYKCVAPPPENEERIRPQSTNLKLPEESKSTTKSQTTVSVNFDRSKPSATPKTQLSSPTEKKSLDPKSLLEVDSRQIRFTVHGKYALAGEDILLGELSPKDQEKWSGASVYGRLPWSRGVELWPRGIVPFAISTQIPEQQVKQIRDAMEVFHQKTSIRFVDYNGEKDALHFISDPERCASYVGRVGGHQPVLVGPECGMKEMIHEMMHVLGFIHEHQRESRDRFVRVHLDQIEPDKLINFDILPQDYQAIYKRLSVEFDHQSLMLYPTHFFAKDRERGVTLSSRDPQTPLAPSATLSAGDILKLQEVYERNF